MYFTSLSLSLSFSLSLSLQVEHTYTGPLDDELAEAMLSCDPEVRKAVHTPLASTVFLSLAGIYLEWGFLM